MCTIRYMKDLVHTSSNLFEDVGLLVVEGEHHTIPSVIFVLIPLRQGKLARWPCPVVVQGDGSESSLYAGGILVGLSSYLTFVRFFGIRCFPRFHAASCTPPGSKLGIRLRGQALPVSAEWRRTYGLEDSLKSAKLLRNDQVRAVSGKSGHEFIDGVARSVKMKAVWPRSGSDWFS